MTDKQLIPAPQRVSIAGHDYDLVAFYFPNQETAWDRIYRAAFLGNFWVAPVTITVGRESATFRTAEAAFQCTKWWSKKTTEGDSIRTMFEDCADGDAAFTLRNALVKGAGGAPLCPDWDQSYAGLQRDGAMKAVLEAKFRDATLRDALLATGGAYLLEHNSKVGRDSYWSDDHDGTGANMLGRMLMSLRAELGGKGEPAPAQSVGSFTAKVRTN